LKVIEDPELKILYDLPIETKAAQEWLERQLEQLDQDSAEISQRWRNALLKAVVLRMLERAGETEDQLKQLIPAAPGRSRAVQLAAMLELAETQLRRGEASEAIATALRTLEIVKHTKVSRVSGTTVLRLTDYKCAMARTRITEMHALIAIMKYDLPQAKQLLQKALDLSASPIQHQQCRSLLVQLNQRDEQSLLDLLRSRDFLIRRDQLIYKELLELTREPIEEPVPQGPS
jgi:hypothetical protein